MDKIMAAHQPNFLPYLGYFDKMMKSDVFVIRDECLYSDNSEAFHRRNKIRVNGNNNLENPQWNWIGIPVQDPKDYIKYATIKNVIQKKKTWKDLFLHELRVNYSMAPNYSYLFPKVEDIVKEADESLFSFNMKMIALLKNALNIKTNIFYASDFKLKPEHFCPANSKDEASRDLVNLCKATGCNIYLSGKGAKDYIVPEIFEKEGIELRFQDFDHPVYKQAYPGFVSNLSAIDRVFCKND